VTQKKKPEGGFRARLTIRNERGLHARAAAKFVRTAARFEAKIMVQRRGIAVSGLSIMGLLTLAASRGTRIEIEATGGDAETALAALSGLVRDGFDEA